MYIITKGILQLPPNIIWHSNKDKFKYNNDLTISVINFLLYVVWVDVLLSVHYNILEFGSVTSFSFLNLKLLKNPKSWFI